MQQMFNSFGTSPNMIGKTIMKVTCTVLMTEAIWQLYKRYKRSEKVVNKRDGVLKQLSKDRKTQKIFEVMFFSNDSAQCRWHVERDQPCAKIDCAVGYFRKIVDYLDSATSTLDICMYFFTCKVLAKAVINACKRGVVVRIVLDETMARNDGSQNILFYREGIELRLKYLDVLMHHKFVIIDNDTLITGSINWTMSAFFGNFENILITNESELVTPFMNEFQRIWMKLSETVQNKSEQRIYG